MAADIATKFRTRDLANMASWAQSNWLRYMSASTLALGVIPRTTSRQSLVPASASSFQQCVNVSFYPPEVAGDMRRLLEKETAVPKSAARAVLSVTAPKVRARALTPPPAKPAPMMPLPMAAQPALPAEGLQMQLVPQPVYFGAAPPQRANPQPRRPKKWTCC